MSAGPAPRSSAWKWWVCGLLLLATTINYMDRQTLSNVAPRIKRELDLNNTQYGSVEMAFGFAFALGATVFGIIADRTSVRWLYPAVLFAWSLVGFLTGRVEGFLGLLACRTFLGFFEAGHWPCALKTTQRILPPKERTMGNSILQSGAAFGAIATPLVMIVLLKDEPGSWRFPFQLIGLVGMGWIFFWLVSVRDDGQSGASETKDPRDYRPVAQTLRPYDDPGQHDSAYPPASDNPYAPPTHASAEPKFSPYVPDSRREGSYWDVIFSRRFLALLILVAGINVPWQLIRVWLPLFLQEGRGYTEREALYFNSAYNVATDVGCLAAGFATLALARQGLSAHRSRCLVFLCCALLTALSVLAAFLPKGVPLFCVLMLIACGSLGLFPCYYSFAQDLTVKHLGKVSGNLGTFAWLISSPTQLLFGWLVDATKSYDLGLALVGWSPVVAFLFMSLLWGRDGDKMTR